MADLLDTIAEHWDKRASTFDDEVDHGLVAPAVRAAWTRRLSTWLPEPPARVADLGCGTGSLAVLLASCGYEVTACDISPEMVQRARDKAVAAGVVIEVKVADAASPQLDASSADVALVRHLAWTLPDPQAAIATWASLLEPHGRLVMVEGRWEAPVQAKGQPADVEHGHYTPVYRSLPWYGGVAADTLIPVLEQTFDHVDYHDLTTDDDLWGRAVSDERYAVVAHRPL